MDVKIFYHKMGGKFGGFKFFLYLCNINYN